MSIYIKTAKKAVSCVLAIILFTGAVPLQQAYEPASAAYNWQETWQGDPGAGPQPEPHTYEQDATWADNSPVHGPLPPMFIYDGPDPEEYEYKPMEQLPDLPVQQPNAPGDPYGEPPEGSITHGLDGSTSPALMAPEEKKLFQQYLSILASSEYFSGLSRADSAALCNYAKVEGAGLSELERLGLTLPESLIYAQTANATQTPATKLVECFPEADRLLAYASEMAGYLYMVDSSLYGSGPDLLIRRLLLEGYTLSQVLPAYGMGQALDTEIDGLMREIGLPGQGAESNQPAPEGLSKTEYRNYLMLADDYCVRADALIEYAIDSGLEFQGMERLAQLAPAYISELRTLDPPASLMAEDPEEPVPTQEFGAPYSYDFGEKERVNLNTGGLVYETVDYVLPGVNGLDLIIGRRYDSDAANIYTPVKSGSRINTYHHEVVYGWLAYYSREGIPEGRWSYYDLWPYGAADFSSNSAALSFLNQLSTYYYPNFDGDGTTLILRPVGIITQYLYSSTVVYSSSTMANNYLNDLYGLGAGWGFLFSSIQDGNVLHLSDGRSYEIKITSAAGDSNLKDYSLTDLRLEKESGGYNNGSVSSAYTLYYKDGIKEYFSSDGKLIGIRDRYNNTIKLVHDKSNSQPRITITDTMNRVTTISSSAVASSARVVTVAIPGAVTLGYTVTNLSNPVSSASLTAYSDPMGIATNYSYTVGTGGFNACSKNTSGATNYFMNLTTITHPTGASSVFGWSSVQKNLGSGGLQACFRLISRKDVAGSADYNERAYSYSANNNSGYPANGDPSNLPSGFKYWTAVTATASAVAEVHTFDNKHLTTEVETKHGSTAVSNVTYNYNADKLPIKVTTRTYVYNSGNYSEMYEEIEYDNKANVTASWPPWETWNPQSTDFKTTYVYDQAFSQLESVTFKQDANTTINISYSLDSQKRHPLAEVVKVNGVEESRTEWTYSGNGNVETERRYMDGSGNAANSVLTSFGYQGNAYLSSIVVAGVKTADGAFVVGTPTYPAGTIAATYEYDNLGRMFKATDARGNATQYQYNDKNDLVKIINPDSTQRQFARSYTANYITFTDELGVQIKTTYTALGQPFEVIDVLTNAVLSRKTYDALCRLSTAADLAGGATTAYTHDHLSRVKSITIMQGSSTLAQELFDYDLFLNGIEKTTRTVSGDADAPSIVTTSYVDVRGFEVSKGVMDGGVQRYDTYTHDYLGNVTQYRTALDAAKNRQFTEKIEYDHAGRATKVANTYNSPTYREYDALGRNTSATDRAGNTTYFEYDALGRLVKQDEPFERDSQTLAVYYASTKYYYDQAGNITREQTQNNTPGDAAAWTRTDYEYNSRNLLVDVYSYDGAAIKHHAHYSYYGDGCLYTQRVGTAVGNYATTTYAYDRFGNVAAITDPLGQTEWYSYNPIGHLESKTDRNGAVTAYANDALGRVLSADVTKNGINIGSMSQSYTLTGQIKTQSNAGFAANFKYDDHGRVKQTTETGGVVKEYSYDIGGNRTGLKLKAANMGQLDTTYEYDDLSRLRYVKENNITQATYSYNANGSRVGLAYPNGTSTTYTYNLASLVTGVQNKKGGATLSSYAYEYYLDGNQREKTDHTGFSTTYLYDGLGRLVTESETGAPGARSYEYAYDARSNRESLTVSGAEGYTVDYQYDLNNRLLNATKTTGSVTGVDRYQYDPNGNTISRMSESFAPAANAPASVSFGGGGWELSEYNGFNQLVRTTMDGLEAVYAYKPDGMRLSKSVGGIKTTHVWDGANIAAELTGNTVSAVYLSGANLIYAQRSKDKSYFGFNAHGDVVQLTNSSGNVIKSYSYDAFGNDIGTTQNGGGGSTDSNPFRFAGQYYDVETGTYAMGARHYAPGLGRWTQADPYWNPGNSIYGNPSTHPMPNIGAIMQSGNLYVYVTNNPVRYYDPSGFKRIDTAYTYTTYTREYGYGGKGDGYRMVVDQTYAMTQVEFTNLNVTLYTLDGVLFHNDPAALARGEHLWMNDPTNLMKQAKATIAKYGDGITHNLNYVTRMDKEQGWRTFWGFGKASVSLISDATMVFGWFAKAIGATGSTGVRIVSKVGTGADVVSYSWSGTESIGKLSAGEINSFSAFLREASGYIPVYGTYKDFESAIKDAGYTVTYYK